MKTIGFDINNVIDLLQAEILLSNHEEDLKSLEVKNKYPRAIKYTKECIAKLKSAICLYKH